MFFERFFDAQICSANCFVNQKRNKMSDKSHCCEKLSDKKGMHG